MNEELKKDVIIEIQSTQEYDDFETDEISLVTEAVFYKKRNKYYIKYTENTGMSANSNATTLKVERDMVTLIRSGEHPTQMIFEENEHHVGLYNTVAGAYTLGIKTKNLKNNINDHGGILELEYEIDLNYENVGFNKFKIEIKE
ncbi:MAG: DUF1934 domain-containing protein [Clostridia bacterium]